MKISLYIKGNPSAKPSNHLLIIRRSQTGGLRSACVREKCRGQSCKDISRQEDREEVPVLLVEESQELDEGDWVALQPVRKLLSAKE